MIEFLKEVLIFMLGRGLVVLVFHLEHNRNDLVAARVALAEDKVALGALGRIVILLEVRVRKCRHAQTVKLGLAVLFERLAHHLGGQADLHVLQALDLFILVANQLVAHALGLRELELVGCLGLFLTRIAHRQLARQFGTRFIALSLRRGDRLRQLHFCRKFLLTKLCTKALGLALGLSLSIRELLTHFCLVIGKLTIRFVLRSLELTLRLGRSSCERHFLSLICGGKLCL